MRTKTEITARHTGKRANAAEVRDIKLNVLDNGLTLIVREDHSAPVVSVQAWSQAGSIDEGKWLGAGMSHALEHMLFKGTVARPAGRIDQEVQDAGGYMNAYTSFDRTVYWINVPNTGATVAIDILCDIMQNATLPAAELEKEKQVILREMDMNQDDPGQRASRRLFETAYTRSPYRFTIIGYPDIFNELKREDLLAYYRQKYAPNNVIFLVVGDIQAAEAEKQIRAAFAQSKSRPCPLEVLPEEPPQMASREVEEEAPIELGHFHFAWHIPDLRHPDMPALDVLAILLGSGRSSRLYQRVREQKGLVNSVDAWVYSPGNPGLFGMSAVVDADKVEAAKRAMLHELEEMKQRLVKPSELAKAARQFTSATLSSLKTMQGQAHDLGANWVAARDLHFSERYLEAVKKLKPSDLQRVARRYLGEVNRTLYALLPNGTRRVTATSSTKSFENPIQLVELSNGLRLLLKEDHRLPFVEFRAVFQGGVLREGSTNNGSTLLLAKMMLQGTPKRSAEEIAREIESLGGSISSYGGNNSFGVNIEVLSSDFAKGIELLADAILNPTFPSGPLERERQIQLAEIKSQRDHLLSSAFRLMRAGLFGKSGYGLDVHGTEKTVRALKPGDLVRLHRTLVTPRNCVLAIFGDIKSVAAKAAATKLFGGWKLAAALPQPQPPPMEVRGVVRACDVRDKKQAVLVIGFAGTTLMHEDRFPLELLQESLSDLGSRLFTRIRDELGLAYYVGAQHFPGLVPGYFALYAGTEPSQAETVEKEMMSEVASLRENGLTAEELKRSKAKVLGQKKIARQDLGGLASTTALDELYGLGYSQNDLEDAKYEAVTLEQVRDVARRYLTPERMVVSVIKPDPAANGSPGVVRADEIDS